MNRAAPVLAVLVALASISIGLVGATGASGTDAYGGDVSPTVQGFVVGSPVDRSTGDPGVGDDAVRVGVIGSEFDSGHPTLDGRVVAHTQLSGSSFALDAPSASSHDTAVAEIVADRTDDAGLYLVGVGSQPSPAEYERAVDWLLGNDVDVIVDSGSYFPSTADGMEQISGAAERATESGAVFVTSAGNYGQSHWRGSPDDEGWVEFADGVQGNRLGDGALAGEVTLRLYWDGDADYDLYLYRDLAGPDDPVVAKSTRSSGNAEAIDATLSEGHYYVAVYARDAGEEPVDLFAAERSLAHAVGEGSTVAPADAAGVISVAAVDDSGTLRRYSSVSADVSAPGAADTAVAGRFDGTSAAAPVVAGAVASMQSDEALSPAKVEAILRDTADGDARAIDSEAALTAAANASSEGTPDAVAGTDADSGTTTAETTATADASAADVSTGTGWCPGSVP
ncbi:S8 family serine peptidase [Halorarum halophilum]|uniref:S8 family serine peptidase n=1 Tax=Halorarum halophilum TaxID=2743090 RepID=A0A7D5KL53_9EURY|nr:S8 family serine peptidase [Halobaculum halophilum]QLG27235.1 S8 family serine peptidase [Halobaculum halophilum]